jgi:TRAP-type C4-dicarboxylate transport system permease small subunit
MKRREAKNVSQRFLVAHQGIAVSAIAALASFVEKLNDRLLAICKWLVIAIVAVLAVILISAVFYRYALNNAIAWSEEGSKYLMVWLTFLGAPIALRHAAHINIDLLVKLFPPRGRQAFYLAINLVIIATMGIMLWKGWAFAELGARQVASSFNFSMVWMYVAVPIGSALTCLVAIELSLRAMLGIADPAQGIDENMAALVDEVRE